MTEAEIELLVLQAQTGNTYAMSDLYQHFHLPMRKFAATRVRDAMVADDLVHNVWLKINKRLTRLNDVSLFRSWLYRALRWEIIDWQRRGSKETLVASPPDDEVIQEPALPALDTLPLLRALPDNEREITELYYLNELSVREISLIVGIPIGTVKSRLHRAREQLKQHYAEQQQES